MTSSYGIVEQASARTGGDLHVERVRVSGFTIVAGGYTRDEIDYLSRRIDALLAEQADRAGGITALAEIAEHETVRCCLAYDEAFVRLASNEAVLDVCRRLLGDYFVLMQQNAIVNPPGQGHRQTACHRDLPYQHFVSSRPLALSALFCVDPFTRDNGATVVLPGTHRVEQFPSDSFAAEIEQPLEAPAGSFLLFDSMLFHRAGRNGSTMPRRQSRLHPPVHRPADFDSRRAGRALRRQSDARSAVRLPDASGVLGGGMVGEPARPPALVDLVPKLRRIAG